MPVRVVESEDAAQRTARWLQRARIPAEVELRDDRFVVLVPGDRRTEATEVLASRNHGLPPLPASRVSRTERIFNVETALSIVFGVAAVVLGSFVVVAAFMVATGLGVALSIALVVAGLAYFYFSGTHGALRKPGRSSERTGGVMGAALDVKGRHAWVRDRFGSGRRTGD